MPLGWQSTRATGNVVDHSKLMLLFCLMVSLLPFHLFSLSVISSINNKLLYNIQVIVKTEEKVILNAGNKCSVFSKYIKKMKTNHIIALLDKMS